MGILHFPQSSNVNLNRVGVGDAAPDLTLVDYHNKDVTLSSFWKRKATAFVFLRHFGCPHCRAQIVQLRLSHLRLNQAGLAIALISLGTPERARKFQEYFDLPFSILCDPQKEAYRRYDLLHLKFLHEANVRNLGLTLIRSINYGMSGSFDQDMTQQGGTFIVNTHGRILMAHRNIQMSDYPNVDDIIDSLDNARSDGTIEKDPDKE
jgi:peroxiredoxin